MCINCKTGGPKIAAIWWRVSTKAQAEQSPDTQIRDSRQMLEELDFVVPDEYIIGADWHSLSILDCPEMEIVLDWVRHGDIHAIGMYHGDRLAGNPAQKAHIMELCDRAGVKLVAMHSPIVEGKEGELVEYVRTWGKEQQVIRAQQASKDGLRDRAKVNGLPPTGRAPYGYQFAKSEDGVPDYTNMVPNNDWPIAKLIWARAIEGVTLRQTAKELTERRILTARGKARWDASVIASMLHNPTYAGRVYALKYRSVTPETRKTRGYGKTTAIMKPVDEWVLLDNVIVEQPIVTWEQYQHVQAKLKANKDNSRRNTTNEYLLRGMIRCSTHHKNYRGRKQNGRAYIVYLCTEFYGSAVKVEPCARTSIGGTKLEQEIWNRAVTLLTDPERVLGELEKRRRKQQESERLLKESLQAIEKRLAKADEMEMRLVSMRLSDDVSETIFERQKAFIKADRIWSTDEQTRLTAQLENVRQRFVTMEQVQELSNRMGKKLEGVTFADKRFVLEALETFIEVAEDGTLKLSFSLEDANAESPESIVLTNPRSFLARARTTTS